MYVQNVTVWLIVVFSCSGFRRLHSVYVMQLNQFISRLILGDAVKYLELKENKSKVRVKPAVVPTYNMDKMKGKQDKNL